MNKLFQYLCPSCGSHLILNEERKVMVCGSCGSLFDYDYFREDNLLELADMSLSKGEFDSASKMYEFMLEKEPDNFHALKGQMLCDYSITSVDEVLTKMDDRTFTTRVTNFDKYKSSCSAEHGAYFDKVEEIVTKGRDYILTMNKVDDTSKNRRRLASKVENNIAHAEQYYIKTKGGNSSHPKSLLVGSLIFFAGYEVLIGLFSLTFNHDRLIAFAVMTGLLVLLMALPVALAINRLRKVNQVLAPNDELNAQLNELDSVIAQDRDHAEECKKKVNRLIYELKKIK